MDAPNGATQMKWNVEQELLVNYHVKFEEDWWAWKCALEIRNVLMTNPNLFSHLPHQRRTTARAERQPQQKKKQCSAH